MGILSPTQLSTQDHLDIEDIRDDFVILKNGSVAVVIETNSLNFELLADEEQDANIFAFANFLNSLTFPIQIVIRTVSTDISRYLDKLNSYQQGVTNQSLNSQINIYKDFISNLTKTTNILDKSFFIIIPTKLVDPIKTSALRQLFGQRQRITNVDKILKAANNELQPKRDHIIKQFSSVGLDAWQMKTDELIKLYYSIYDPDRMGGSHLNLSEKDIESGMVNQKVGNGSDTLSSVHK